MDGFSLIGRDRSLIVVRGHGDGTDGEMLALAEENPMIADGMQMMSQSLLQFADFF